MKNVYEVLPKKELDFRLIQEDVEMLHRILSQKELEFQRVQKEIAALRSVIPLLAEDTGLVECEPVVPPSFAAVSALKSSQEQDVGKKPA